MKGGRQRWLRIRRVRGTDAAALAELCGQLGYPAEAKQIKERLKNLKPAAQHAVFVAERDGTEVAGWVHVSVEPLIEADMRAEVNGLVVREGERSRGAGWKLLEEAERWAKKRGCKDMSVRSNVIRERAHQFYESHGYEHYKTQKAFRKPL
jgi:GNAT superfamily N-acetyltransferase